MRWSGIAVLFTFLSITSVYAQNIFVIDSCNDGDAQSALGGWWYTYTDSINGGNSRVIPYPGKFSMDRSGFGNRGYAAHMKGVAGDKLGWDFIGMGVTLSRSCGCPESKPVDLKGFTTIQFKMKGTVSGGRLILMLPYTENKCEPGSDHQKSLTSWGEYEVALTGKVKSEWTTIELSLRKDFHQPKWVKQNDIIPIDKVLENAKNINFQFSSPDGDSIDLWLDDIIFIK